MCLLFVCVFVFVVCVCICVCCLCVYLCLLCVFVFVFVFAFVFVFVCVFVFCYVIFYNYNYIHLLTKPRLLSLKMLELLNKITSIKNRNVTLFQSVGLIVALSFAISFISKFIEMKAPFHKKHCGEDGVLCPTMPILVVRFLHYLTTFFYSLYYFIFNEKYDLIYLCLYVGLILHWLIINDCILSSWEMYYYDKEKRLGDTGLLHPHLRVFVGDSTDYIIFFQIILMTMSFILVINRLKTVYYPYLFGATVIILQMYMVLKDRIEIAFDWSKTDGKPVNEDPECRETQVSPTTPSFT